MAEGWIKLHRKILKSAIWKDCTPVQKTIMVTLLLMANGTSSSWVYDGERHECEPG